MVLLPLFRFGSRARLTSWGIAFCTMFVVASFSIANGLQTSMDALSDNFVAEYDLLTLSGKAGPDFFSEEVLSEVSEKLAIGTFVQGLVLPGETPVMAFAIEDPYQVLPERIAVDGDEALAGVNLPLSGDVLLHVVSQRNVTVTGKFSSSMFPSDWLLVSPEALVSLTGQSPDQANFCIAKGLTPSEISQVRSMGFCLQDMVGVVAFLQSSVDEIRADVFFALVPSAFVVAVLSYSFVGAEVSDRRREIGIVKTLGAGRRRIVTYLGLHSLLICCWGGLLGLALGIIVAYGFSTVSSHIFVSVLVIELDEGLLVASYLATVGAGLIGAMFPATRMTFTSPAEDLVEVGPSS